MQNIQMQQPSADFEACWHAAGRHLQSQTHDGRLSWLKANLTPPFLEHLSFRMGNQLFFVRVEDVKGRVQGPGNLDGLRTVADGCNGYACRMPMQFDGSHWESVEPGWGLVDEATGEQINPIDLVSDEKIEMTNWEVHDFAVQVVRDFVTDKLKYRLMSSQGNPSVDPSLWFIGDHGPEWVVVRAVRYPEKYASRPENMSEIAANCSQVSVTGRFASVSFANSEDPFNPASSIPPLPLWRGHGVFIRFEGLEPASQP